MRRWSLSLVFALMLLSGWGWQPAQASELCDRIFNELSRPTDSNRFLNWIRDRVASPAEAAPGAETASRLLDRAGYWVVIDQGTARSPDCEQGLVRSFYYLPGTMVRPLLDIGSEDVLVVTEHGLYVALPARHLQPLTEEDLYVFSDSLYAHAICVNSQAANPDCDSLLQRPGSPARLSSIFSYAHGSYRPELSERRALYQRALYEGEMPREAERREFLCERFNVGQLYARSETTQPMPAIDSAPAYGMVSMSLCAYSGPEPTEDVRLRANIKMVTAEVAEEAFTVVIPTLYLRRSDQILDLNKIVDRARGSFRNRKDCSEELSIADFQTVGLSAGLSLNDLKFVQFGGNFQLETKTKLERTFDGEMFVVSGHIAEPEGLTDLARFLSKTYDIWSIFGCTGGRPTDPKSIVLYHTLLRDSFMGLSPEELHADYEAQFGKYAGPTRSTELGYYSDGYIWRHTDYQDFMQWRFVLREALQSNPKIADLRFHDRFKALFDERPYLFFQLVDHFVQLTMAATFYSEIGLPRGRPL